MLRIWKREGVVGLESKAVGRHECGSPAVDQYLLHLLASNIPDTGKGENSHLPCANSLLGNCSLAKANSLVSRSSLLAASVAGRVVVVLGHWWY